MRKKLEISCKGLYIFGIHKYCRESAVAAMYVYEIWEGLLNLWPHGEAEDKARLFQP